MTRKKNSGSPKKLAHTEPRPEPAEEEVYQLEGVVTSPSGEKLAVSGPVKLKPIGEPMPVGTLVRSGVWSRAENWAQGVLPREGDDVVIPSGKSVILNGVVTPDLKSVTSYGEVAFSAAFNNELRVGTLDVTTEGLLTIGTADHPVHKDVKAVVTFLDRWGLLEADVTKRAVGLLARGKVAVHGAKITPWVGEDAESPLEGWENGHRLAYPPCGGPSMYYAPRPVEVLEYGNFRPEGVHEPVRRGDGTVEFGPHLLNLERNVVFRSESPDGVRGHCMFEEDCRLDLRYAAFVDLGRTTLEPDSVIGRYAVHVHKLRWKEGDTGVRFNIHGCVVERGKKWGIAVHDSHMGNVTDNVVFQVEHAGIVTEEGSESHNLFRGNFVADVKNGHGFWLQGVNNYFYDNVVAACWGDPSKPIVLPGGTELGGYGWWFVRNTDNPMQSWVVPTPDGKTQQLWRGYVETRWWKNNECYSVRGGVYFDHKLSQHTLDGLKVWSSYGNVDDGIAAAVYDTGDHGYVVFSNLVSRGASVDTYSNRLTVLVSPDIRGCQVGLRDKSDSGVLEVKGGTFENDTDIAVTLSLTSKSVDPPVSTPLKHTLLESVRCKGKVPLRLSVTRDNEQSRCPVAINTVEVRNWQGQGGSDLHVYFKEQHRDVIVPYEGDIKTDPIVKKKASPEPGLTNRECWEKYGLAWAGGVAPEEAVAVQGIEGALVTKL